MSFWGQLPIVVEKNAKRIIRSPLSVAIIFLGPFLILLLINSVYQQQDTVQMDVGLIMESDSPLLQEMRAGLETQGTSVRIYGERSACVHDIQWGFNDACVLMTLSDGKPSLTILMDYSEINFVPVIIGAFNERISKQSSGFREEALQELSESIQGSLSQVQGLKTSLEGFSGGSSPTQAIDDLTQGSNSDDFQSARESLSEVSSEAYAIYTQNTRELNEMMVQVTDLQRRVDTQLSALRSLRSYGQACDNTYLPSITQELSLGIPETQISSNIQQYARCKCVEYYQSNLASVENDLVTMRSYLNDVNDDISDARERNDDFYNTINDVTSLQNQNVASMEYESLEAQARLRDFASDLQRTFSGLRTSMDSIEGGTASLLAAVGSAQETIESPVEVKVESILPSYSMMVFLFPFLYFFILIFITLIFSATFSNSEHRSTARGRNILAPLREDAHVIGTFITLLALIFLQAFLLLTLGLFAFGLPLTGLAFGNILAVTVLAAASYVLIGMCIGYLFASPILVMFSAIGVLIVSFVYADTIVPLKMLSPFAQTLASTNPFSIGIEAVKQFLFFNTTFDVIGEYFVALFFAIFIPFIAVFFLVSWRRRQQ